jgi:hypothetical protein
MLQFFCFGLKVGGFQRKPISSLQSTRWSIKKLKCGDVHAEAYREYIDKPVAVADAAAKNRQVLGRRQSLEVGGELEVY